MGCRGQLFYRSLEVNHDYYGKFSRGGCKKPEGFILAVVEFMENDTHRVHYVHQPFQHEPDFGMTSVNYDFAELLARAGEPS